MPSKGLSRVFSTHRIRRTSASPTNYPGFAHSFPVSPAGCEARGQLDSLRVRRAGRPSFASDSGWRDSRGARGDPGRRGPRGGILGGGQAPGAALVPKGGDPGEPAATTVSDK